MGFQVDTNTGVVNVVDPPPVHGRAAGSSASASPRPPSVRVLGSDFYDKAERKDYNGLWRYFLTQPEVFVCDVICVAVFIKPDKVDSGNTDASEGSGGEGSGSERSGGEGKGGECGGSSGGRKDNGGDAKDKASGHWCVAWEGSGGLRGTVRCWITICMIS